MTYANERIIRHADSHVMETREWLEPLADAGVRRSRYQRDQLDRPAADGFGRSYRGVMRSLMTIPILIAGVACGGSNTGSGTNAGAATSDPNPMTAAMPPSTAAKGNTGSSGAAGAIGAAGAGHAGSGAQNSAGAAGTSSAGAPPGTPPVSPPSGPAAWSADCQTTYQVHAFGASDPKAKYHVTPDMNDAYICWYFAVPWGTQAVQGLEFRSVLDQDAVVHHWLLYGTDNLPQAAGTAGSCSGAGVGSSTLITGWAPGRDDLVMPRDVGLQLPSGPNAGLILQTHYYANGMDVMDGSGVDLCTTDKFRPNTATISWLGSIGITLPAGQQASASGTCKPNPTPTEPIHILRTWPHMHLLGTHMTSILTHAAGGTETLVDKPFDFNYQASYETPLTMMPGDSIKTTCQYDNTTTQTVRFGQRTSDEMCFAFVYAYPAGLLSAGLVPGLSSGNTYCIGP